MYLLRPRFAILMQAMALAGSFGLQAQNDQHLNRKNVIGIRSNSGVLQPIPNKKIQVRHPGKPERINKAPGDTLFFQDFEDGTTWPTSLQRLNVDGRPAATNINTIFGNNAWVVRAEAAPLTNQVAASASWTNPVGQANRWMVTPPVTLNGVYDLSWKSMAIDPQFPDGYEVRLCTNCPATITNNNVLSSFSTVLFSVDADQTTALEPHVISLADYQNQTVRIAVRNNSNDMFILHIDDLLISKKPGDDISADAILSPSNSIYDCSRANFPIVVAVSNNGGNEAQNVTLTVSSTGPVNDSKVLVIPSLPVGAKDTIEFTEGLNMSVVGDYELTFTADLTGDEIIGNNTALATYSHAAPDQAPFKTDFDGLFTDSILPGGWFTNSGFLPFNSTGGVNGGVSIELPVFNNNQTLGTQASCSMVTSKYKNVSAGDYLTFKYKLINADGTEYVMSGEDSIVVKVFKNCAFAGNAFTASSASHEASSLYKKIFVDLGPYNFSAIDDLTVQFTVKSDPATAIFLCELDDFAVGPVATNDVAVVDLERFPFSQVKRSQLGTLQFKGSISNEGLNTQSPVRIEAFVSPVGITDTARISSIASGSVRTFTTSPGINLTQSGDYIVNLSANLPNATDENTLDNSVESPLSVTDSTMAKDFGTPLDFAYLQYGAGSSGKRIIANAIRTTRIDTMTSVSVYVGPLDEDCSVKAFFANRNATTGAWVEDSSAVIVPITVDMADSWVPLRFFKNTPASQRRGKPVLANSENLYGVKIRGGNLRVGFNFENATEDGSFIWLGTSLLGTQDITLGSLRGPFAVFIRANFGRLSTIVTGLSQLEQSLHNANIVPNPAQGNARLVYAAKEGGEIGIQVYNMQGKLSGSTSQMAFTGINRLEIPTSGLEKGIYLVKVQSKGFETTKKLIID
jgi:hypothetical protein